MTRSEAQRLKWKRPEYRAKQQKANKDPVVRAKRSISNYRAAKRRWQSPEYRAKQAKATIELNKDPIVRADRSVQMKKLWQDPQFRLTQVAALSRANSSPAVRIKQSRAAKRRWTNPVYRTNQAKASRGVKTLARKSKSLRSSWKDESVRLRRLQSRAITYRRNLTPTEKCLRRILRYNLKTRYHSQVLLAGLIVDFYLYDYNIALEVDQQQTKRTRLATRRLERAGYVVVRISNHTVTKYPDKAIATIQQAISSVRSRGVA